MMKIGILAICLGLVVAFTGLSETDFVAKATETQLELQTKALQTESIHDGYLSSAHITMEDEIAVLTGEVSWSLAFKQRVTEAIRTYQTRINISDLGIAATKENEAIMVKLFQEIRNSNPDFFYLYKEFEYTHYEGGNAIVIILYYDSDYLDANGNIDMNRINAYTAAKNQALSVVKAEMTDVEKLLVLHDYLVLHCSYDYENLANNVLPDSAYNSYGALVNRTAVSSGYAMAYASLVKSIGINCYIVASDAMNHAWNMVYVDGAWYHIDTTRDDGGYGYTIDYNSEGIVDHTYFLRSDAEMQAEGYYDWFEEYTYARLPQANQSGTYANTIFGAKVYESGNAGVEPVFCTSFSYHDGFWYYPSYVEGYEGGYENGRGLITRSKIDGSQKTVWTGEDEVLYVQVMNGRLYYADLNGMYTAAIADDLVPEHIMTMVGSKNYRECVLTEFAVYSDGAIGAELKDITDDSYKKIAATINTRETIAVPQLIITKSPTVNYFGDNNKILTDGTYALKYNDGVVLPVNAEGISAVPETLDAEGVYDVELEWRGLTTSHQVSVKKDFPVSDVLASISNWQYSGIKYVVDKGYMVPSGTLFSPDVQLSRSMLVQILYAMEDKPKVEYIQQFTDVFDGEWYAEAVTWAYANGITSGYEDGRFGVNDPITREQAALMLQKYAQLKGVNTSVPADLSKYIDTADISGWAKDAMGWANYNGIISGKGILLDPIGSTSRAEMAAMITKFCTNVIK